LTPLKWFDAIPFYKSDSNAAVCLSDYMIATSMRFAKKHERRGDLVAELENTSSGGGFVRSPKADFS
jgi:hypothetical protein